MQHILISCLATAALLAATQTSTEAAGGLARLAWLSGTWKVESKGKLIEEHWTTPAGGMMLGVSRTIVNGKTVSFEFLRIEERENGVFYVAQPEGKPPTEFRLASSGGDVWAFENLEHDFPQRIIYRRNGDGSVTARIEDKSGKKGMEFAYSKAK